MTMNDLAKKTGSFLNTNSPAILLGLSIAGVITTAYLTHKAAQKAEKELSQVAGLTAKEKVQITWKYYVPPVLSCGATLGFIIAGHSIQHSRNAGLAAAVSLSQTAFSEYREKMVETVGKNKERKAVDELIQEKVTQKEKDGEFDKLVVREDKQEQYVYDTISGRVFVSTIEKLNKAANEVARECINNDYANLNLFYSKIGLAEIRIGETLGWNNSNPLELNLSNAVVMDGRGLIAINYIKDPIIGYDKIW